MNRTVEKETMENPVDSALGRVAAEGDPDKVRSLIEAGAEVDAIMGEDRNSPLLEAVSLLDSWDFCDIDELGVCRI